MKDNLIIVNGIIVEREEARISPFDRGFMFGDGVFEITPVYNGRPLDAEKHMENLFRNVIQLRIPVVNTVAELAELLEDFASYTELQDGEIYTQITRGAGPYELDFPEQCRPQMIMQIVPVDRQALAARRAEGVNLMTVPDERPANRKFNVLNRVDEVILFRSLGIEQLNAKLEATGDHRDFQWFQIQAPQLGTNAQAAQFAVGQNSTASVMESARARSGAHMARILRPGQVTTMEFNAQRLNLEVDAGGRIVAARCG